MCCVMPPASPAVTSVSRIASSSEVLPWSTWPMIDDDRRAVDEVASSASSNIGRVDVVGRVDDLDLLVELVGEDLDRLVGQRLRERRHLAERHQLLDDLRAPDAEVLGDVLDGRAGADPDDVCARRAMSVVDRRRDLFEDARGADVLGGAWGVASDRRGRRGRPDRRAAGARRAACESITTRRRPPGPTSPGVRSPVRESRVGRTRSAAGGRRMPLAGASALAGAARRGGRCGAPAAAPAPWRGCVPLARRLRGRARPRSRAQARLGSTRRRFAAGLAAGSSTASSALPSPPRRRRRSRRLLASSASTAEAPPLTSRPAALSFSTTSAETCHAPWRARIRACWHQVRPILGGRRSARGRRRAERPAAGRAASAACRHPASQT